MVLACGCVLTVVMGWMGEWMDYRMCMTLWGGITMMCSWLTVGRSRREVLSVYEKE